MPKHKDNSLRDAAIIQTVTENREFFEELSETLDMLFGTWIESDRIIEMSQAERSGVLQTYNQSRALLKDLNHFTA